MRNRCVGIGCFVLFFSCCLWAQEKNGVIEKPHLQLKDSIDFMLPPLEYDYPFLLKGEEKDKAQAIFDRSLPSSRISYKGSYQKALLVPGVICVLGLYVGDKNFTNSPLGKRTVNEYMTDEFPDFHTKVDDYLQYLPIASVYGLHLIGVKGKHDTWTATKLLALSELVTGLTVHGLKNLSANSRPNGRNQKSFPSGHTAQSFVAATFLHREYGHLSAWYSVGGYAAASAVGVMRMLNEAHWLNDVCVGAALGMAFTNLVYLRHDKRKAKKEHRYFVTPAIGHKYYMLSMNYQL